MKAELNNPPLSKNLLSSLLQLKQKKFRKLTGKTLTEGVNLLEQLISNGIQPELLVTTEPEKAKQLLAGHDIPVYTAKEHELAKLAETESPQAWVGVYSIPTFNIQTYKRLVYLDGIRDPGNLGAIFRIAAAFDLDGIVLSEDCCEVFSPKVVRASLGSVFWIAHKIAGYDWLQQQPAEIVGLAMDRSVSITEFKRKDVTKPLIVVVGSEGEGIRAGADKAIGQRVSIPISDKMESLNAGVAAGIALFELTARFGVDTNNDSKNNDRKNK